MLQSGPPRPVELLKDTPICYKNHPSFAKPASDGSHPARAELQGLVEAGFGRLYHDRASAERELGGECRPAPLGDVVKITAEGKENTASSKTSDATA